MTRPAGLGKDERSAAARGAGRKILAGFCGRNPTDGCGATDFREQHGFMEDDNVLPAEKLILVVDDDVTILRLVRETLAAFFFCNVDTTPSPEYAFELALKKHYDLFLFDFQMPMIDGALLYNLVGKVYSVVEPPLVLPPLILMSGHGEQTRARALLNEPGVRGLLPKPFTLERLAARIEAAVPASAPNGKILRRPESAPS